ncbi:MAG: sulfurtransferase [Sulfobacillus acidophilus]|uniref:Sulfurtransferase n=1 Tax=Sulfobacillus acidophilus TaxID=53633 RepID=A0A2T2WIU7_9FIRM|nr:MAG: sulfurtransferase [Sulfobacillus acidophilus]
MTVQELHSLVDSSNAVLLDIRLGRAYAEGHIRGAVSAPFSQRGWARSVAAWMRREAPSYAVILFGDNQIVTQSAAQALKAEGIVIEAVWDQGLGPWREIGLPVVRVDNITVDVLRTELETWAVIDVREPYEHRSGVIPGALKVPLAQLPQRMQELDPNQRYAVICATGSRSQSAAAWLAEQGFQVANVVGGMSLWLGGRHPVERG